MTYFISTEHTSAPDRPEKDILERKTDWKGDLSGSSYIITFQVGLGTDEVVKLGRKTGKLSAVVCSWDRQGPGHQKVSGI